MKLLKWLIALTFSIFILSGQSFAVTYKIAVVPWIGCSPLDVAEDKGFFKEQGVDVKIFSFSSIQAQRSALQNKLVDFGYNMIGSAVGWRIEGDPVVFLAETDWSHGGDKIIVKENFDLEDLRHKPVGVYLNQPAVTYFFGLYLNEYHLDLSDVRVIEMEPDALAERFIQGVFNAVVFYDPEALRAEREGGGEVVATSASYEGCIPEGILTMEGILADVPHDDLLGILKGWVRAVEWIHDENHWEAYKDVLNRETFASDPPYSDEDLRAMFSAVKIHDAATQLERNRDGGGLFIYLKNLEGFLERNKMLESDLDVSALFQNDAVVEVLRGEIPAVDSKPAEPAR